MGECVENVPNRDLAAQPALDDEAADQRINR